MTRSLRLFLSALLLALGAVHAPVRAASPPIYASDIPYINIFTHGAKGDGTTSDNTALTKAATAGGANNTLFLPGNKTYRISANLTLAKDLQFAGGAAFTVDSLSTLTIGGQITSVPQHIFKGEGSVVFTAAQREYYPHWWGGLGSDLTGDQLAIEKAAAAINSVGGGTLVFPKGNYYLYGSLTIPSTVKWKLEPGAVVKTTPGVTLNPLGPVDAGLHQWIDKSAGGDVSFAANKAVDRVLPQWWGAKADTKDLTGLSITGGTSTLTGTGFTSADVNKVVSVYGAGTTATASGSMTSGSAVLTLTASALNGVRPGMPVKVPGAGAFGADLITTFVTFESYASATLADPAQTSTAGNVTVTWAYPLTATVTAATSTTLTLNATANSAFTHTGRAGVIGTDDTQAMQAAATAAEGRVLFLPPGGYTVKGVKVPANTRIEGPASAALRLKPLTSSGEADPILDVTGSNVTIAGITFDGQRAFQGPGGYSDSYNSGTATGFGRHYRSAIRMNAHAATGGIAGIENLRVERCHLREIYGAGVAAQNVGRVYLVDNVYKSSNFEFGFLYATTGFFPEYALIGRNHIENIDTGYRAGYPNGNGLVTHNMAYVTVVGNHFRNTARDSHKCEAGRNILFDGNTSEGSANAYTGLKIVDAGTGAVTNAIVTNNIVKNYGKGFLFSADITGLVVRNNLVDTTVEDSDGAPDGLQATGVLQDADISGNTFLGIRRIAIYLYPKDGSGRIRVSGNALRGQGAGGQSTAIGILVTHQGTGAIDRIEAERNRVSNFPASSTAEGLIRIKRLSTGTFTNLSVINNDLNAGGAANRGLYVSDASVASGTISGNTVDGKLEVLSPGLGYGTGNSVTGVVTLPAGEVAYAKRSKPLYAGFSMAISPSIAAGGVQATPFTVPGAALGDLVTVAYNQNIASSLVMTARTTGADTVTVYVYNSAATGSPTYSGSVLLKVEKM